jgi:thiol-disulfide isomerase/thioredoxin
MKKTSSLHWSDLKSETMNSKEYLENSKPIALQNYEDYVPKIEVIDEIRKIIDEKEEVIKTLVIGADWCPDCNVNTPKMIQVRDKLNNEKIGLKILYGVKVKAIRKKGERYWHPTQSPPEATDPKFDLNKIPTIYFFNKEGTYLGRIVENPRAGSTIEEDMLEILKKEL